MTKRDFGAAVDEARRALDAGLPSRLDERLRARLRGEVKRRRRVRWGRVGGVGAAVAVAVVVVVALQGRGRTDELGGYAVVERSADAIAAASDGAVTVSAGRCVLRDGAVRSTMVVSGPATLRRLADGVAVLAGTVELDVEHDRPRAAPVRVRVSHGAIEVLGTRFTVVQGDGGGEVTLHQGSIRFRADDGRTRTLAPGQALRWPLPPDDAPKPAPTPTSPPTSPPIPTPEPAPTSALTPPSTPAPTPTSPPTAAPTPPAPTPTPGPTPKQVHRPPAGPQPEARAAFDAEALLERVAELRSRGRYDEAAAALTAALRERHDGATDERLSFELGAILTRHLGDAARACAHWKRHREAFSGGRYEREIAQARTQLGCAE